MLFFIGAVKVLVFSLCLAVALAVIVFVPLTLYCIPYALWVGSQNTRGRHKDKQKEPLRRSVRNATRLYAAWITRKEPTF